MTHADPYREIERFVDGECSPEEAARIELEIATDTDLAKEVHRLEELNLIARAAGRQVEAPQRLRQKVEERYAVDAAKNSSRFSRRRLLAGSGLLAAGLAAVTFAPRLGNDLDPVETFFRDYETFLLKDKTLDVHTEEMVKLAGWYGSKLPFDLPPVSSHHGETKLRGGRLCWLMHRHLASLSYDTPGGPVVLYIMHEKGIHVPDGRERPGLGSSLSWHRLNGNASVIWRSNGLLYVMVGAQDVHGLIALAGNLAG